jgi:mannose-6-phosphate isomerase-like protein (cupin superfamily)
MPPPSDQRLRLSAIDGVMRAEKNREARMEIRSVRRIVTGHDSQGRATIISDAPCPHIRTSPQRGGVAYTNLWQTARMPAPIDGPADPVSLAMNLEPPPNGCNLRIVEFEPEAPHLARIDAAGARAAFAAMGGAGHALTQETHAKHPWMHRTKSVDYGIVLSGEIYLVVDDQEVLMRAGDVCIQRGTNHAWSNRSETNCTMAFVLIDGDRQA